MKQNFFRYAAVAALAGGMAFAQTTAPAAPPAQTPQAGATKARPRAMWRHRMAQRLNLTPDQKQQAKSIFQQARQQAQPIRQELQQNRQALSAAVKSDNTSQIQSLAAKQGSLRGQLLAIHSEAMAKFYGTLTPDQRAKADQFHQKMRERFQQRMQRHAANTNG